MFILEFETRVSAHVNDVKSGLQYTMYVMLDVPAMTGASLQCSCCRRPPAAVFLESPVSLSGSYSSHSVCAERYRRRKKPLTQGAGPRTFTESNLNMGETTSMATSRNHISASSDSLKIEPNRILAGVEAHIPATVFLPVEAADGCQPEATWRPRSMDVPSHMPNDTIGNDCKVSVEGELRRGEGEEVGADVERGRRRRKRKRGKMKQREGEEGGEDELGTRRVEPASPAEQRAAERHQVRVTA